MAYGSKKVVIPPTPVVEKSWMHYRRSGKYHGPQAAGGGATAVITANRLYAYPFSVPVTTTFDRIAIQVTTAAAGSARLGIYADNGAIYPGALILDAGTVNTGTTGTKEIEISQSLSPGLYWLVFVTNAGPTFGGIDISHSYAPLGHANPYVAGDNLWAKDYTFNSLPASFPDGAFEWRVALTIMLRKL